jgi:predicted RNase H-like HicB family nuclease
MKMDYSLLNVLLYQVASRKEALENIRDAIKGYLESLKKHNEPIPPTIEEEIVEVTI